MNTEEQTRLVSRLKMRRNELADALSELAADPSRIGATRIQVNLELAAIDAALARFDRGTFGACCRCELDIETDRLRAEPSTPFCSDCLEEVLDERRRLGYRVRAA